MASCRADEKLTQRRLSGWFEVMKGLGQAERFQNGPVLTKHCLGQHSVTHLAFLSDNSASSPFSSSFLQPIL
jgi:hypothetical protein